MEERNPNRVEIGDREVEKNLILGKGIRQLGREKNEGEEERKKKFQEFQEIGS